MTEPVLVEATPSSEIWSAKQLADVARQYEKQRTGHEPAHVTAVLIDDTLVITLRGALSSTENELAKTPVGASQVRENHRQVFLASSHSLQQQIEGITGVGVLEATSEVSALTGTVVQFFMLAASVAASTWSESTPKSDPAALSSAGVNGKPDIGGES